MSQALRDARRQEEEAEQRIRAEGRHDQGRLKLRLILDRFSVEVFVNDGEQVMSATLNTDPQADAVTFLADGWASFRVRSWPLTGNGNM